MTLKVKFFECILQMIHNESPNIFFFQNLLKPAQSCRPWQVSPTSSRWRPVDVEAVLNLKHPIITYKQGRPVNCYSRRNLFESFFTQMPPFCSTSMF